MDGPIKQDVVDDGKLKKALDPQKAPSFDEKDLVQRARLGDVEAYEKLFALYYSKIFRLAFRLCGQGQDAEEVAQETFVRVARSIKNFRGDSKFNTWITRIAVNTAYDLRSKRRRHMEGREDRDVDGEVIDPSQSGSHEESDLQNAIKQALDHLPPKQREVMVLTFMEGYSHEEAAEMLKCSINTVSWRVFAAKKKLKSKLKRFGY